LLTLKQQTINNKRSFPLANRASLEKTVLPAKQKANPAQMWNSNDKNAQTQTIVQG
jgi:hypothetical protein